MSRVKVSLDHDGIRRLVWLVLTVLVLLGCSLQSVAGGAYYSLLMQTYTTVSSPPVILENGTFGTSTIYTNKTCAKVSVSGYGYDFVDHNDTNVDSSENKGTQSNFTAQKYGPDLTNDTLTEENTGGGNYEFDVEVQWTSVDYDETYEELCIRTGAFSGTEDLMVYAWNVSASNWQFLYNLTANSWNNVSVTDWLNNKNFTVRFLGGIESGDASQDYWDIDATLLHIWTETDYNYDYVLRANNTDPASWQIRLKKYAESNINRLENCTIYFHNSTNGASTQIYIQNGIYINQTGPWYDLDGSETIYIAMTAQANSTGTSYVRVYLEILTLDTTTYAQYVIAFEIT